MIILRPLLLFMLIPFFSSRAQNFEGVVTFNVTGQGQTRAFQYFSKGNRVRVEMEQAPGMTMVVLIETKSGSVTMLIPQNNAYMEMNLDQIPSQAEDSAEAVDITETGKKETILGYECRQVFIRQDNREAELWVTKGLGTFVQSTVNPRSQSAALKAIDREITSKGYFPLRMITRSGGTEEHRTEVVSVSKKPLSDDMFKVPAGYTKMQMPQH
ncbi:MAG TPA: DUF4412 domain-containing protein [Bacteroidota bacterium]